MAIDPAASPLAPELLEVLVTQAVRRGLKADEAAEAIQASAQAGQLDGMQRDYVAVLAQIEQQMTQAAERAATDGPAAILES